MLQSLAVSNDNDTGLSHDDLRIATALVHCRFRGLFSGITHERSPDGKMTLVVWGTERTDEPRFVLTRSGDRYLAIDELTGRDFEAKAERPLCETSAVHDPSRRRWRTATREKTDIAMPVPPS